MLPALLLCALASCGTSVPKVKVPAGQIHYLALGDSYTAGTGVDAAQTWPSLVAGKLEQATGQKVAISNLGIAGFTTFDVIHVELPRLTDSHWDVVTIQVGVNDWVQRLGSDFYRDRLREIYDRLDALRLEPGRVVAVSTPDFSFTPTGPSFGSAEQVMSGLRDINVVAHDEASRAGFPFVDIFDVSRSGIGTAEWIADDGLHPGPAQYRAWADAIWEAVEADWSVVKAK